MGLARPWLAKEARLNFASSFDCCLNLFSNLCLHETRLVWTDVHTFSIVYNLGVFNVFAEFW